MRTRSSSHLLLLVVIVGVLLWSSADVASASSWVPTIAAGSTGEAHAQAQPSAPTGVSAVCTSSAGKTIKVTWSAVSHATSYSIYKSTTSASSGYTLTASGVTGTTWTSATLSNATYWFEVAASIGTFWASPNSTGSASHIISGSGCV